MPYLLLLGLAGCGGSTEAPVAEERSDVAAEAVADVDAAMAEATTADRLPAAGPAN